MHPSKIYRYAAAFVEDGHKSRRRIEKRLSECAIRHDTVMCSDGTSARKEWMRGVLTKARRRDPTWGLLLISDDAAICGTPMISEMPPDNWDILYFGGRVDVVHEHTTEHWKRGLFQDAKAVIIRMRHIRAIERALDTNHARDWDWVLHKMQCDGVLRAYCYSPQFVGSYRALEDKQTGIYHMEDTPKAYDIVSLSDSDDDAITKRHVHILCPTRGLRNEYHNALWELLLYQYMLQSRKDDKVTLHIDTVWDDVLSSDYMSSRVRCHDLDSTCTSYGSALNAMIDAISCAPDDVFAIWRPGYYYDPSYVRYARSCPKMLCGASRVVLYEVSTQKTSWFVPTDVNAHEIILEPALCIWRAGVSARFTDADVANPILSFAKDVGFDHIGSFGDNVYGFRIVTAMSNDDRAKMVDGAPGLASLLGNVGLRTKQFFEDTCSGLSVVG